MLEGIAQGLRPFVITALLVAGMPGFPPQIHTEVIPRSTFEYKDLFCTSYHVLSLEETSWPSWLNDEGDLSFCGAIRRQGTSGQHLRASAIFKEHACCSHFTRHGQQLDLRTTFLMALISQQFLKSNAGV